MKLPRCTPASKGMDAAAVLNFIDNIEKKKVELHSLMLLKEGEVIAEGWWSPYQAEYPHLLNSLSKSFTSAAIGFAANEGKLSLDDKVISFFPEEATEEIAANMGAMNIRHLLTMSTGHNVCTNAKMLESEHWVRTFLNIPIVYEPGSTFVYNTGATYMLAAILHKTTGEDLLRYLEQRLFAPLGISGITSTLSPQGVHAGGYGMSMKTEDIAKFGQLLLQKGVWQGKPLLPSGWTKEATVKHISNEDNQKMDWAQGYGYQFWMCSNGAYRGDGAFGQLCVVFPEQKAVLAITGGVPDMQVIMDAVWEHLYPSLQQYKLAEPAVELQLQKRLSALAYPALGNRIGFEDSVNEGILFGQTFTLEENQAGIKELRFVVNAGKRELHWKDEQGEQQIVIGDGTWIDHAVRLKGRLTNIAVCGAWASSNSFEVALRMLKLPYTDVWSFAIEGSHLSMEASRNIGVSAVSILREPYIAELEGTSIANV